MNGILLLSTIQFWWISWAIALVVIVVVAALLSLIIVTARRIDGHAAAIWLVGKQIAGNTVSIWMLEQANQELQRVRDSVRSVEGTAASMDEKLRALAGAADGRG